MAKKHTKNTTPQRTYRPITGIARKAGIPKPQMEAALIEGFGKLCGFVWDLATLQQFDESDMAAQMLEHLEQWLNGNHELLAPVANEILQQKLKQPITNWDGFKMWWEQNFPTFPLELKRTYTASVQAKPGYIEPSPKVPDFFGEPW